MTQGTTTPAIAGLAVGIAFVVLFSTAVLAGRLPTTNSNPVLDRYRHVDLSLDGLKGSYRAGEPIDFLLVAEGFDAQCDTYPSITIANSTGDVVWTYEPAGLMGCGDPDANFAHDIRTNWNTTSQLGSSSPIVIHRPGSYTLRATYHGRTVERGFTVANDYKENHVTSISPSEAPRYGCPKILVGNLVRILNSTGFKVYDVSGFANYAIEQGHRGTITFTITRGGPPTIIGRLDYGLDIPVKETFDNNAIFVHKQEITVEQNITSWVVGQFGNETDVTFYQACHDLPAEAGGGTECSIGPAIDDRPPAKTVTISLLYFNHPGIDVTFDPKSEVLGFNESVTVTASFSIDPTATRGTYWMELPPGHCNGSPTLLFTVGSSPYVFPKDKSPVTPS
jgi:hypothetical protein